MMKYIPFLSLFLLIFLLGCADSKEVQTTKQSLFITPKKKEKTINNRYQNDPMVLYFDVNKDGCADMWKVYVDIVKNDQKQKVLIRREIDMNYDGIPDYIKFYSEKGQIKREFLDQNFDQIFDTIRTYENNKVVRIEHFKKEPLNKDLITRNLEVMPFKVHYFTTSGMLKKITEDRNSDGKEDYFFYYLNGKLDRIGIDDDGDLKIDRWIKHPEESKKRTIKKGGRDEK